MLRVSCSPSPGLRLGDCALRVQGCIRLRSVSYDPAQERTFRSHIRAGQTDLLLRRGALRLSQNDTKLVLNSYSIPAISDLGVDVHPLIEELVINQRYYASLS